jgi:hypothetical protein
MTHSARLFTDLHLPHETSVSRQGIMSRPSQKRFAADALPASSDGWIYVCVALYTDCYKVGWARDPLKRVRRLQEGSPFDLLIACVIAGSREDESAIQLRLSTDRTPTGGREWFMRSERSDAMFPFDRLETVIDPDWLRTPCDLDHDPAYGLADYIGDIAARLNVTL